jgi:SRSO17 transposase
MEPSFVERKEALLAECEVSPKLIEGMLSRLEAFVEPYARELSNREQRGHLRDFVAGLCAPVERKTSETIAYFHQQDRQALQRFVGWVEWDHRPLLAQLARQVGQTIGEPDGILIIDPSAHSKKGTESVGVQRQWNGRAGKIDNCQIGVYLGYASRQEQALVDVRLYLPQNWAKARKRRAKCRVPREVKFATKLALARDLIETNRSVLPHAWVVGDDELGRSTEFRRDLRAVDERYVLATPSNTLVRDLAAEPLPSRSGGQRRAAPFVRVDQWRAQLPASAWTRIEVRDGEKGPLAMDVAAAPVLAGQERSHPERTEVLVVTRRVGEETFDYWLSNAAPDTPRAEFARAAQARSRIEQCFQRAKSETGLSDYETRSWPGWHHHQTLSLLASWFLVVERRRGEKINARPHVPAGPHGHRRPTLARDRSPRLRAIGSRHRTPTHSQRLSQILSLEKTQPTTALARASAEMN